MAQNTINEILEDIRLVDVDAAMAALKELDIDAPNEEQEEEFDVIEALKALDAKVDVDGVHVDIDEYFAYLAKE
jgi:hypothetical protein